MCTEKHVLEREKKTLQMGSRWIYLYNLEKIRQSIKRKHWLSGKEKDPGAAVNKEGHADSLLRHERYTTIDFFEKDETVNSASYCLLHRQYLSLFIDTF